MGASFFQLSFNEQHAVPFLNKNKYQKNEQTHLFFMNGRSSPSNLPFFVLTFNEQGNLNSLGNRC
ncbi:MAG TPA: hypothetical protein VFD13_02180, partial [Candidatus Kapabacteria bacterium]|nr:hypothetical protein [Candidatus Kapabacteria bacterium]